MKPALLFFFILLTTVAYTQTNVLLLQKHGKTQKSFFAGHFISIQTRQGSYANGIITKIQEDSIYIRHFDIEQSMTDYGGVYFDTAFRYTTSIHYKDIGAVIPEQPRSNIKKSGTLLLIAGGGVMALGAINGLYRGDKLRDWYKPTSYIVAGALAGLGVLFKHSGHLKMRIGKKYTLKILLLDRR
ncbi:MAG TPA: hypothetical protein VEB42_05230 [Chitinophagaceae bacterium]|nr:hypothetical protein [Chitinophagaceae bacterium]